MATAPPHAAWLTLSLQVDFNLVFPGEGSGVFDDDFISTLFKADPVAMLDFLKESMRLNSKGFFDYDSGVLRQLAHSKSGNWWQTMRKRVPLAALCDLITAAVDLVARGGEATLRSQP